MGVFPALESELVTFAGRPGERSPNRLDALVWAIDSLEEIPRYGKGRRPYVIT